MEKKLVINLGDNKIVAEIYDKDGPEFPPEIIIYLCDKDDVIFQDICLVRPHYEYDEGKDKTIIDNNRVDCIVWGESGYEDYTDKYVIAVYDEEGF